MGTYTTEGGFINTNLVTTDEDSQEFDDLIFALKTGEDTHKLTRRLFHLTQNVFTPLPFYIWQISLVLLCKEKKSNSIDISQAQNLSEVSPFSSCKDSHLQEFHVTFINVRWFCFINLINV